MHPLDQILSRDMIRTAIWAFRAADDHLQVTIKSTTAHPADIRAAEMIRDDLTALIGKFEHVLTLNMKGRKS